MKTTDNPSACCTSALITASNSFPRILHTGACLRIAVCDMKTKRVTLTKTRYKSVMSVEGAFANFTD